MARILIVDDNPSHLELMRDIITKYAKQRYDSKWDLKVQTCLDAPSALTVVEERNYELIIVDILMAQMDGFEFIKRLRKKFPQFAVPIIIVSAINGVELEYKAMRHGASAWFQKPLALKKFAEGVFTLLRD